jgi:hypothetical protein
MGFRATQNGHSHVLEFANRNGKGAVAAGRDVDRLAAGIKSVGRFRLGPGLPPQPGDQVLIIPQEGDSQHGLIVGRLYSNMVRPPNAEPGEINLSHQSGSSIRLLNSGIVAIAGDLHVSGDVYDAHGALSKLRNDYNVHIHHTSSGQITSGPLPLD